MSNVARVTISDVARRAKVAKSTASLSFSAPERVSKQTLDRVLNAAREIGYAPNAVAQSLKTGRNNLMGFIVSDMRNPHNGSILRAVQEHAAQHSYLVITATSDDDPVREMEILHKFRSMQIRGTILTAAGKSEDFVQGLRDLPMTFVTFDQKLEQLQADHVGLDNRLAVRMLTRHLLDLGHRHIGHISGTAGFWTSVEREEGIRDCMREAGLDLRPEDVLSGQYRSAPAYEQTLQLLNRSDRPTALIAANNLSCHGALKAIRAMGLRCPDDISLVSVDVLPWSDLVEPRLTCTIQPVERMAARATEWLLERLDCAEGAAQPAPREVFMVPDMSLGTSTAAPKSSR